MLQRLGRIWVSTFLRDSTVDAKLQDCEVQATTRESKSKIINKMNRQQLVRKIEK